ESQRHQSVDIKQILHGKLAKISCTSLLLKIGASGVTLRTGRPVIESITILTLCRRFLRGVKTMRPASIFASSGSPARIPSLRRRGPGSTTCPLVETLVCMVRQSYQISSLTHNGLCLRKSLRLNLDKHVDKRNRRRSHSRNSRRL